VLSKEQQYAVHNPARLRDFVFVDVP
jgi:hypothetical protein